MPKGVDHLPLSQPTRVTRRVQKSLMPKGVDHAEMGLSLEEIAEGAKIFDAERR